MVQYLTEAFAACKGWPPHSGTRTCQVATARCTRGWHVLNLTRNAVELCAGRAHSYENSCTLAQALGSYLTSMSAPRDVEFEFEQLDVDSRWPTAAEAVVQSADGARLRRGSY